jgi:hypothetical protein
MISTNPRNNAMRTATLLLLSLALACSKQTPLLVDGGLDAGDSGVDSGLVDGGPDGGDDGGTDGGLDGGLDGGAPDAGDAGLPHLTSTIANKQFMVAEHMRASLEMQISGEPFAQLLGYNLFGFNRTLTTTDQYAADGGNSYVTDPLGYALAIETYEYSKQPMNNLSFESGAGLSLMFGPLLNPTQQTGDAGYALLATRFQQLAAEANASGPANANLIVAPPPVNNPLNYYGWPGLWPEFAEFESFDPTIAPIPGGVNTCTFRGSVGSLGYGGGFNPFTSLISNYECDYNSLNLPHRDTQVVKTLTPDALGYVVWKQGLWTINYWQSLQDTSGNAIIYVQPQDMASVGQPGNTVVGSYADPADPTGQTLLPGDAGVYLGDIRIEGWQGLTMMDEIDNKSSFLLGSLLTADGVSLTGAASVLAAIDYAYDSPLLYFPAAVSVVETAQAAPAAANRYFPQPTGFSIQDPSSHLGALSGLIGGFAEAFSFTDRNNSQVGGSLPFEVTFDGDPFPQDNGMPDGENTLHDRALGILKIALIDLDRLHFDATHQVLVDTATVSDGGIVTRGGTVSTVEVTEAILALRNAFRSMNGSLQLYSNDTPDSQGAPAALDGVSLSGASYTGTLQAHIIALITSEADFLANTLVAADGSVANSYDLGTNTADATATGLEAEAAAIRGLLDAYLATSDQKYRDTATQVYADLQKRFWMTDVLCFRTTAGVDNPMQFTPIRFGLLEAALRQYYKLVASAPSRHDEGVQLLAELKRTFKLVVNGWNDQNQDDKVQYPDECTGAGLEFGERALTGELGHGADLGERDRDCVKEISKVGLPAALAAEVDIQRM